MQPSCPRAHQWLRSTLRQWLQEAPPRVPRSSYCLQRVYARGVSTTSAINRGLRAEENIATASKRAGRRGSRSSETTTRDGGFRDALAGQRHRGREAAGARKLNHVTEMDPSGYGERSIHRAGSGPSMRKTAAPARVTKHAASTAEFPWVVKELAAFRHASRDQKVADYGKAFGRDSLIDDGTPDAADQNDSRPWKGLVRKHGSLQSFKYVESPYDGVHRPSTSPGLFEDQSANAAPGSSRHERPSKEMPRGEHRTNGTSTEELSREYHNLGPMLRALHTAESSTARDAHTIRKRLAEQMFEVMNSLSAISYQERDAVLRHLLGDHTMMSSPADEKKDLLWTKGPTRPRKMPRSIIWNYEEGQDRVKLVLGEVFDVDKKKNRRLGRVEKKADMSTSEVREALTTDEEFDLTREDEDDVKTKTKMDVKAETGKDGELVLSEKLSSFSKQGEKSKSKAISKEQKPKHKGESGWDGRKNRIRSQEGSNESRESDKEKARRSTIDDASHDMPVSVPHTTAASTFVYGVNAVLAALSAKKRLLYHLYIDTTKSGDRNREKILSLAKEAKLKITSNANPRLLDRMSNGRPHNGIVLEASQVPSPPTLGLGKPNLQAAHIPIQLAPESAEDLSVNGAPDSLPMLTATWRHPFILMLDGILDEGNLGNILRTAYFYGVDAVAISKNTCASTTSPIVAKASSGAIEAVQLLSLPAPSKFVYNSLRASWKVYAAVAPPPLQIPSSKAAKYVSHSKVAASSPLRDHPCILMLGAEGEGLRGNLTNRADYFVSIEQGERPGGAGGLVPGIGVDSMNVSSAAGILVESFMRKPAGALPLVAGGGLGF